MERDPVFVEIYSKSPDAWTWSVAFNDLARNHVGRAGSFAEAMTEVLAVTRRAAAVADLHAGETV